MMNKRNRIRAGLGFGIFMSVFCIIEDLFTNHHPTTNQIFISIVAALIGGAISGVLFAWLIGLFSKSKFIEKSTRISTNPDENILFATGANHFKGIEGVGGKLYLTTKRLIFKSHKLNAQNHQLAFNLADIYNIDTYKTLGVINNGLSITTDQGKAEKFIVEQLDKWEKHLTEKVLAKSTVGG